MPRHLNMTSSLAALTLGGLAISQVQTTPAPQWSVVTTTQIKPEFRQEYEAAQKEITAAYKKAGASSRIVVQTMLGDVAEYISIAPIGKLADMDEPSPTVKALGEVPSQRLLKRMGAYIVSIHRATTLAMDDVSIRTTAANPGEYAAVSVLRLHSGKAAEFASFMKDDYLPAMRKAEVSNLWVSRPIYGGDLSDRIMVRPIHKFAELDGGPITTKALGAEGARQLSDKQNKIVASTHYTVVRVRPDLSLMPSTEPPKPKSTQ